MSDVDVYKPLAHKSSRFLLAEVGGSAVQVTTLELTITFRYCWTCLRLLLLPEVGSSSTFMIASSCSWIKNFYIAAPGAYVRPNDKFVSRRSKRNDDKIFEYDLSTNFDQYAQGQPYDTMSLSRCLFLLSVESGRERASWSVFLIARL